MNRKSKEKIDEDEVGGKFLAIYPDHSRLVQRRVNSQWIYSYVPSENDLFSDKQPYYSCIVPMILLLLKTEIWYLTAGGIFM